MAHKTNIHPMSAGQLSGRKSLSNDEILALAELFEVSIIDLSEICGCTYSTFQIYIQDNSTPMPAKHQATLIEHFSALWKKYPNKKLKPKTKPNPVKKKNTSETPDPTSQNGQPEKPANQVEKYESEPTYEHIDKKFEHLSFASIIFRPKNGNLGKALEEAAEYSEEAGVPVHIRTGDKTYKIEARKG